MTAFHQGKPVPTEPFACRNRRKFDRSAFRRVAGVVQPLAFVGVARWGGATAVISGPSRTVLQRATPARAHGRVLSADFVAASSAELLGVVVAGGLVTALGVQRTIVGLGGGVAVAAVLLARADRRDRGSELAPAVALPTPGPV